MRIIDRINSRLVYDWRTAGKWYSTRILGGGALFAAVAFALSLSSSGMQFIGVFGLRGALALCVVIFVCALIGRVWRQDKLTQPPGHDADEYGA